MLLTKYVRVGWNPSNRDWYTSKGYVFTKWFDEIEIPVDFLSPSSNAALQFTCDFCGNGFERMYKQYRTFKETDVTGKHACTDCRKYQLFENKRMDKIKALSEIKPNDLEKHYRVDLNENKTIFLKVCKGCGCYKELDCFRVDNINNFKEYHNHCTECEKDFREVNKTMIKLYHIKTTSNRMNLPVPMTERELEKVYDRFKNKCALTMTDNVVWEHFIPVSWGHGGTYVGNIYLLHNSLNLSKGQLNPFTWIKRPDVKQRIGKSLKYWNLLVKYLAGKNGLSVDEFIDFVNWCEKNKRTPEEVKMDGDKTSIELWRESLKK